ncbi:hypothetical protein ACX1C1_00425 [Paenibacillus sp. strain BS8-2]
MWERALILTATLFSMLLYDGITLRGKQTAKSKFIYGVLLALILYTGLDYVVNQDWVDYLDFVQASLGGVAQAIDAALKVQWD